jgi:hypothetical protein
MGTDPQVYGRIASCESQISVLRDEQHYLRDRVDTTDRDRAEVERGTRRYVLTTIITSSAVGIAAIALIIRLVSGGG